MTHGLRSQSGIRVRSRAAWDAYVARHKLAVAEADRREALRAEWRKRERAKADLAEQIAAGVASRVPR